MAVNYREVMETFIKDYHENLKENAENITLVDSVRKAQALDLFERFMMKRFDNELRQYNNDVERAYDLFIMEKNLNIFNIYVEELYELGLEELTTNQQAIKKEMRKLHNSAWAVVNDIDDDEDEYEDFDYSNLTEEELEAWFGEDEWEDVFWEDGIDIDED